MTEEEIQISLSCTDCIERKVKVFGKGGAHITVPLAWLDKDVVVGLLESITMYRIKIHYIV
ncbi:MAG: DUF2080 family transposase-associated protein [Gammaproteobacteria bacterium]|nr:DUF2080 family transposase-associated protein [Gammaproteobacteria bacterium]